MTSSTSHGRSRTDGGGQSHRACETCGAVFQPKQPSQRFCGSKCRHRQSKVRELERKRGLASTDDEAQVAGVSPEESAAELLTSSDFLVRIAGGPDAAADLFRELLTMARTGNAQAQAELVRLLRNELDRLAAREDDERRAAKLHDDGSVVLHLSVDHADRLRDAELLELRAFKAAANGDDAYALALLSEADDRRAGTPDSPERWRERADRERRAHDALRASIERQVRVELAEEMERVRREARQAIAEAANPPRGHRLTPAELAAENAWKDAMTQRALDRGTHRDGDGGLQTQADA